VIPAILPRLQGVQQTGSGWSALCPAHGDEKPSLSVAVGDDGRVLVHCHAGCTIDAILKAVDLTLKDLAPERREIAAYPYHDGRGRLVYQVVRYEPKDFRMRRPDGQGGWSWSLKGIQRVVYRLPELQGRARVFFVEGEKDADALVTLGLPATTTPGGAAGWRDAFADQLVAAGVEEVLVVPDNDEAGRKYAQKAAGSLLKRGIKVGVLELPGLLEHGDVSDWLAAGGDKRTFNALVTETLLGAPTAGEPEPEPELIRDGLNLSLVWPDVRFDLAAARAGDGVRGELTVVKDGRIVGWADGENFGSVSTRWALQRALNEREPDPSWSERLTEAIRRFSKAMRVNEPTVTLTGRPAPETYQALVPDFLYTGEPTMLFGDGESAKSITALLLAIAVQSGRPVPFIFGPARQAVVLYLDWETHQGAQDLRLSRLAAGLGIEPPPIFYRRMTRPLVEIATEVARECQERGVGLVVVDSMIFALGGEGKQFHETVPAFFNAARLFAPAATLIISHVTKADTRGDGPGSPFGGAFAYNGPRLVWGAKRDKDRMDQTWVRYTCTKANDMAKPSPFGLHFWIPVGQPEVFRVERWELAEETDGAEREKPARAGRRSDQSLSARIVQVLAKAPTPTTAGAIAVELHANREAVSRRLRDLRRDGVVDKTTGDGPADRWFLLPRT